MSHEFDTNSGMVSEIILTLSYCV